MKQINLSFNLTKQDIKVIELFKVKRVLYENNLTDKQNEILNKLYAEGLIQRFTCDYLENYGYELIQHDEILKQIEYVTP